jgi:hypothetical protein
LRARGDEKRAEKVRGLGAEVAFREIDDEHFAPVHHVGNFERRTILTKDRSDEWVGEECADLVLDRRDRLVAQARVVGRIFGLPKGSHARIAASTHEPIAIGFVDEQARKPEQGLILGVEQEPERMTEDVFEARPPALRPDVFERRDDVGGGRRALGLAYTPARGL